MLSQKVAVHEKDTKSDTLAEKSPTTRIKAPGKTSINWLRIAELTGEQTWNGIFGRQELLRFKARIAEMTPTELLATLAETKTLGLNPRSYGEIDDLLITTLMGKDLPAAADYLTIPENNHIGLPGDLLEKTISTWMKNDFPAVLAWFDGKVSDGSMASKSLSGKNHIRLNIEASLLTQLYPSDPATVTRRLKGYPENQRFDLFKQIFGYDKEPDRSFDETRMASQVALAREVLPTKDQSTIVIKSITPLLKSGDYEKLEEFLILPTTTAEDRSVTVRNAAGPILSKLFREDKLTLDEIDKFHGMKSDPAVTIAWYKSHRDLFPGDSGMMINEHLLRGTSLINPKLAFALIGELEMSDQGYAVAMITNPGRTLVQQDAALSAAREYIATVQDPAQKASLTFTATSSIIVMALRGDMDEAFRWIDDGRFTPAEIEEVAGRSFPNFTSEQHAKWFDWIVEKHSSELVTTRIIPDHFFQWVQMDYQAAGDWLTAAPEGPARTAAAGTYAYSLADHFPETAAKWPITLPPGEQRDRLLPQIYQNWLKTDPAAAATFARQNGIPE